MEKNLSYAFGHSNHSVNMTHTTSPARSTRICPHVPIEVCIISTEQSRLERYEMTDSNNRSRKSRPDGATIERARVHIDSKGRLSVDVAELAASKTFRTELGAMVELAKTHPPKTATS